MRRKNSHKKYGFESRKLQNDFAGGEDGDLMLYRGLEVAQGGGTTRKGWRKIEEVYDPQRNYAL